MAIIKTVKDLRQFIAHLPDETLVAYNDPNFGRPLKNEEVEIKVELGDLLIELVYFEYVD